MRQRWQDAETWGKAKPEEWRPDSPPFQIRYIWIWFLELHSSRHTGPKGPLPITYQDMVSWSMLTERKLGQFEISTIRQLDQRFFYVLRTPNGSTSQFLDQNSADQNIVSMFRAMMKKPPGQGVAELPKPKAPIKIPVITFKKN